MVDALAQAGGAGELLGDTHGVAVEEGGREGGREGGLAWEPRPTFLEAAGRGCYV